MNPLTFFYKSFLEDQKDLTIDNASVSSVGGGSRKQEDVVEKTLLRAGFHAWNKKHTSGFALPILFHRSFDEALCSDVIRNVYLPLSLLEEDRFYFMRQPFGSQNKPDFLLFRKIKDHIHWVCLECKSSKHERPMWNDAYPSSTFVYLFTRYGKQQDSTFFLGEHVLDEATEKKLEYLRYLSKKRQQEDNDSLTGTSVSVYHRLQFHCSEKHLFVKDRDIREKDVLTYMKMKLHLSDVKKEEEADVSSSEDKTSENNESTTPEEKTSFTAISLFSGAGGDTLGLEQAGVRVVAFSEKNKDAVATHKKNFPHSRWLGEAYKGDITKIPDKEFECYKGKIDILFAGFPCQAYSHAGKKDPNDPRNQLFREFVRVASILRPKWIIGENVKGILKRVTKKGEKVVDVIVSCFQELGYSLTYDVVQATHFGVPQKRERFLLLGSLQEKPPSLPQGDKKLKPNLCTIITFQQQGSVEIPESLVERKDKITWINEPDDYVGEESTPPQPPHPTHPFLLKNIQLKRISFRTRFTPNHGEMVDCHLPSKTIICSYSFQPRFYVGQRKKEGTYWLRTLTVQELQQIQGFPKSFSFSGNITSQIQQIGNAVPPPMIRAVVKMILA